LELEPGGDRYFVNDLEKLLNVLKKS
jgi:hypothetical protein